MADTLNIFSLYSGSGMHDEGIAAALSLLGYGHRVVGYVEREAAAAGLLMARMENQTLSPAPVWCDEIEKLDARPLRGWVDILTASPPCQPYSTAGKRIGESDHRSYGDGDGPLAHTIRVIAECQPAVVWFENVPEWVTGGAFRRFGEELSGLGYQIEDPLFIAASDVGAPHQRDRVFILGHSAGAVREWNRRAIRRAEEGGYGAGQPLDGAGLLRPESASEILGHTEATKRRWSGGSQDERRRIAQVGGLCSSVARRACGGQRVCRQSSRRDGQPHGGDEELGESGGAGREGAERRATQADEGPASRGPVTESGIDVPIFPPGRDDYRRWAELFEAGLEPTLMPAIESGVSVVDDGMAPSAELLRIGGNGVVPLQSAVAFCILWERMEDLEIRA